jgi:ABC-2 type transport system permease protein
MGVLGIIAGIQSDKVDELAAFTNFIILPLTFLSGVFYSIHSLPPLWQWLSHVNPFFYMIDGFRYGFFGQGDVSPWLSLAVVTGSFAALSFFTLWLLRSGYKLRH